MVVRGLKVTHFDTGVGKSTLIKGREPLVGLGGYNKDLFLDSYFCQRTSVHMGTTVNNVINTAGGGWWG